MREDKDTAGNRRYTVLRTACGGRWIWTEALGIVEYYRKGKRSPTFTCAVPTKHRNSTQRVHLLVARQEVKRCEIFVKWNEKGLLT